MLQVHDGGAGLWAVPGPAKQSLHSRVGGGHSDCPLLLCGEPCPRGAAGVRCQPGGRSVGGQRVELYSVVLCLFFFFFAMGDFTGRGVAVTGVAAPRRSPLLLCRP